MSYAFFPGCSLEGTAHDYQKSTLAVSQALGLALPEIPDWTCCGSTSAHQTDQLLSLALPAKNLVAANGQTVAVGCAACYSRLKTANHEIASDPQMRKTVATVVGKDYDGKTEVLHLLEILARDVGLRKIAQAVQKPLKGLKVVTYYGCLLVSAAGGHQVRRRRESDADGPGARGRGRDHPRLAAQDRVLRRRLLDHRRRPSSSVSRARSWPWPRRPAPTASPPRARCAR